MYYCLIAWCHGREKEISLQIFTKSQCIIILKNPSTDKALGKNRLTVVSIQNKSLFFCYYLLIIILFFTRTTVNLLLSHPVYGEKEKKRNRDSGVLSSFFRSISNF